HSPLLVAFPNAQIYTFDRMPVQAVAYEDLDHVRITRDFLNAPHRYLSQILQKGPGPEQRGQVKGWARGRQGRLPNPDRHPDLVDAHIHRRRDLPGGEAPVGVLRQTAGRNVGHTIVAHAARTNIDGDRSATGGKTEQHAGARGPHPRRVAVEVVARRAAAAVVPRVAPEQRPAHGRKSVDAEPTAA